MRLVRSELSICLSAQAGVDVNQVLQEIVKSKAYKRDYEDITESLLFSPVSSYETGEKARGVIKYVLPQGLLCEVVMDTEEGEK